MMLLLGLREKRMDKVSKISRKGGIVRDQILSCESIPWQYGAQLPSKQRHQKGA